MAEFISKSAIPSEGSMQTSWPALRNLCCPNLDDSRPRRQRIRSLRDNRHSRAVNGRAQAGVSSVVCLPQRGRIFSTSCGFTSDPPPEGPDPSLDLASGRRDAIGDQWIGIHSNGIDTYPLEWTASWNGLVSNALESIAYQCNSSPATAPSRHPSGERDKRIPGCGFTTITVTPQINRR